MQRIRHSLKRWGLRFEATTIISIGVIALLVLLLLPTIVQSICLNKTFIAITSALIEPAEQAHRYDGCLSDSSPLLAGERGRLRLFQIKLAFAGPEAAEQVLAELSPETLPGRLAHFRLCQDYLAAGDDDAAIPICSRADAILQLIEAGNAASRAGDHQRTMKFWLIARSLWQRKGLPTKVERKAALEVLNSLIWFWEAKGAYQLATEASAERAQIMPSLKTLIGAGRLYFRSGDLERAKQWYEAARELAPSSSGPYYGLGHVFVAEEQWNLAVSNFEKAVELDPDNAEGWYWLGRAYEQIGQHAAACEAFRQALESSPSYAAAQQALDAAGCESE